MAQGMPDAKRVHFIPEQLTDCEIIRN
jgi:hypothetical protein